MDKMYKNNLVVSVLSNDNKVLREHSNLIKVINNTYFNLLIKNLHKTKDVIINNSFIIRSGTKAILNNYIYHTQGQSTITINYKFIQVQLVTINPLPSFQRESIFHPPDCDCPICKPTIQPTDIYPFLSTTKSIYSVSDVHPAVNKSSQELIQPELQTHQITLILSDQDSVQVDLVKRKVSCPVCGARNKYNNKFCVTCGKNI